MADIDELKKTYFADAGDISITGEVVPHTSHGNDVKFLVDGHAYFGSIKGELERLATSAVGKPYFYFAVWHLGLVEGPDEIVTEPGSGATAWTGEPKLLNKKPFALDDGSGAATPELLFLMAELAQDFDLRALVWVTPFIVNYTGLLPDKANRDKEIKKGVESRWRINMHSLWSVKALREIPGLEEKVVVNTLAHTAGAMHLKMAVCGDDAGMTAYVSGLDFVASRVAGPKHEGTQLWHDAGVSIQGPAALTVYQFYRQLFTEQLGRSVENFRFAQNGKPVNIASHSRAWETVPKRDLPPIMGSPGPQVVQVLRTLPQMNFTLLANDKVPLSCLQRVMSGYRKSKISFAEDGVFEFRLALRKAISNAKEYIYIEDQSFTGQEIMHWINERLRDKAAPNLKVILLYGSDPDDPPGNLVAQAINRYLLNGIYDPSSRIGFYVRGRGLVVHSKVTIIDDYWAAIGSANCMRRSLYTDGELSVGVLDERGYGFARDLRVALWAEHCRRVPTDVTTRKNLEDLKSALGIWKPSWGKTELKLDTPIQSMKLPFVFAGADPPQLGEWPGTFKYSETEYYFADADSREEF